MNQKDIKELKKYFSSKRVNIPAIYGAVVNENGGIDTIFSQDLYELPEELKSQIIGHFRKVMSGSVGSNLIPVDVVYGEPQQAFLEEVLDSRLKADGLRNEMFQRISKSLKKENSYIILAAENAFDLMEKGEDDEYMDSDSQFSCLVYAICPVKRPSRMPLYYNPIENGIYSQFAELNVGSPEEGFVYPSFEDGGANISRAMYYSKDTAVLQEDLIQTLFAPPANPMPAEVQKEDFNTAFAEALGDKCDSETVIRIHDCIRQWSREVEESVDEDPEVTCDDVAILLRDNGIAEESVEQFRETMKETAGKDTRLTPGNLVPKKDTYETANIKISVKPEFSELIKTDIIDGRKCIIVFADEGVSVNGVNVQFSEEE